MYQFGAKFSLRPDPQYENTHLLWPYKISLLIEVECLYAGIQRCFEYRANHLSTSALDWSDMTPQTQSELSASSAHITRDTPITGKPSISVSFTGLAFSSTHPLNPDTPPERTCLCSA